MDKAKKNERMGYGFNRTEGMLRAMKCDRVFLDFKGTNRAARYDLLHMVGLRAGDVVCVIRESDLGYGVELKQVRELIAAAGATIEVAEWTKKKPKAETRGMEDDVKAVARPLWRPGVSEDLINDQLAREGKRRGEDAAKWGPFTRSQFKYALGAKSAAHG